MKEQSPPMIPIRQAVGWIGVSLAVTVFTFSAFLFGYHIRKEKFSKDPAYTITALIQGPKEGERLQTEYFAELLNLSVNYPSNLYALDLENAKKKLQSSPLITHAAIFKLYPNALKIEYHVRQPIAYVTNIENGLIDAEGVIFPLAPYLTPKKIPSIQFAPQIVAGRNWGEAIAQEEMRQAIDLMQKAESGVEKVPLQLVEIDLRRKDGVFEEIVLTYEELENAPIDRWLVRVSLGSFEQKIEQFLQTRNYLLTKGAEQELAVVDLRLSQLALITGE